MTCFPLLSCDRLAISCMKSGKLQRLRWSRLLSALLQLAITAGFAYSWTRSVYERRWQSHGARLSKGKPSQSRQMRCLHVHDVPCMLEAHMQC